MNQRKIQHRARILAMQALYAQEHSLGGVRSPSPGNGVLRFSWLDRQACAEELFCARLMVEGVCGKRPEIDLLLQENLHNWSLERLLAVDRAILRLGIYMLQYLPETPTKVVLDECIELCHSFSSEQSYRLVNGVLHTLASQLRQSLAKESDNIPPGEVGLELG